MRVSFFGHEIVSCHSDLIQNGNILESIYSNIKCKVTIIIAPTNAFYECMLKPRSISQFDY